MRRAAWIALFLCLFGACSSCASGPLRVVSMPAQTRLVLDYRLLRSLAFMQSAYNEETAWCLVGVEELHRVSVYGLEAPLIVERTHTSVQFGGCEGVGVVGWYHNHPKQEWDACSFSDTDEHTFRENSWALMLGSCDGGVFFYQLRGESGSTRIEPSAYLSE